jgi:bifunctional DNA-binding transcriptional regulator/antitoxin component of YhaV-PrlF toxin-antitoxin module
VSEPTTVTLQELDDGELYFDVPDAIWETLGWDEGTVLDWTVVGDSIRITRVPDELSGQSGVAGNISSVERSD